MKFIYLLFLVTLTLFSASIDSKLYEDIDKASYFDVIKKQIDTSKATQLKDNKLIQEELSQLLRVREVSEQKISLEPYNLKEFKSKTVNTEAYYKALKQLSLLNYKLENNSKINVELQSKILYLKKMIENITEIDKDKLLLYQLQFAYYKLQQKNIETKISLLQNEAIKIKELLFTSLANLTCPKTAVNEEKISTLDKNILGKKQELIAQELQKEKALIEENKLIENIAKEINLLNTQYQNLLSEKISLHIVNGICFLKEKNNTSFYKVTNSAQDTLTNITDVTQKQLFQLELNILKDISKVELGRSKLLFGATIEESKAIITKIQEFLLSPLFIFNERSISLFSIFKALLYIVFGFLLGVLYKRWILKITRRFKDISMMSVRLISNIGYYLIVLVFLIISIGSLGIDMTSLSLIAGALSIGIGFGLQTVVSNLIAGIILMFERTIRIGDLIEINDVLSGTVTDMRIRSTTIKTFDNIDIVVPNSSFVQNNVINMTLEDRIRRLHIPFSVAYGTEIADVKSAVLNALSSSSLFYIKNDEDKKPDIRMTLMNSSSVDLELIVWVNRDIKLKFISIPSDFLILIYNALRANDISIPFPQLDVYMKQMLDETKKIESNL